MSDSLNAANPSSIFSMTDHELYVVTARDGSRENGQIATWIMPATLVPESPRVVAVLSPMNMTHELIERSGRFVLNMLSIDQSEFVPLFGLVSGREIDKLHSMLLERTSSGLPVLPGTCGWAECVIAASIDAGDRMVYVADVVEQQAHPGMRPLRKREAFARQSEDIRALLERKHQLDGERDRALIKRLRD
ncbi:MAG: flavin reductase [Ignavibacteriae bacterium]|nr:flavin reductase [Ignavibacteriota bacterium]